MLISGSKLKHRLKAAVECSYWNPWNALVRVHSNDSINGWYGQRYYCLDITYN